MIPTWLINTVVIILGSVVAIYLGATLPEYDFLGAYVLAVVIICSLCMASNNFPLLLSFGIWTPVSIPVPFFRAFPTVALVLIWFCVAVFFRSCRSKSIQYVTSCNALIFFCFLWCPVRFLLSPVTKLGAGVAGGSGVSGVNAYLGYAIAFILIVILGCILDTKEKVYSTMRWSFRLCVFFGFALLVCAFIPATQPYLTMMGMFAAGDISDGISRLVELPVYGLFIAGAALCPKFFKLNFWQAAFIFIGGLAMIVIGGNRANAVAVVMVIPFILLARRKYLALAAYAGILALSLGAVNIWAEQIDEKNVPGLARVFGVVNSKIETGVGGDASAEWRYAVWKSGIQKIMESPLIGKGFGNLPKNLDPEKVAAGADMTTDFETVLAGGMAHNGFIVAAYGFGIPFMLGLTIALVQRLVSHAHSAMVLYKVDPEQCDLHAMLGSYFFSLGVIIYTASDMSGYAIWFFVGIGIIFDHVTWRAGNKLPNQTPTSIESHPPGLQPAVFHWQNRIS